MRLVQPFVGGAFAKVAKDAIGGMERALDAGRGDGVRPMSVAHHRVGRQRPDCGLRGSRATATTWSLFEGDGTPGGHVATVSVDAPGGAGRSRHRLHRLQRADLPAPRRAVRRPRRRDAAERHVVRVGLPVVRRRVRLAGCARVLRPARPRRPPVATCGCSPTSRASTATRAPSSMGRQPTGLTLGEYLADRRFGPAFRDHFLIPITAAVWSTAPGLTLEYPVDYLLRFLDNHGLIGVRSGPALADGQRRLADLRRTAHRDAPGGPVRTGDPVVAVTRDVRRPRWSGRPPASPNDSTPSCSRPTRTRPWRSCAMRIPAERTALAGFEYNRNEVVLHTDERVHAAAPSRVVVVECRADQPATRPGPR